MSVTERLQLLTTLLERVRRNANRARSLQTVLLAGDGARAGARERPPVAEVHSVVVASTPEAIEAPIAAAALGSEPPVSEERLASAAPLVETSDLLEEDIVDITLEEPVEEVGPSVTAQAGSGAGGVADVDIDFDEPDSQPPSSSRRAKVSAESLDAVAEREVPLKTPPPESGPQEAVPPAHVLQQPPPPIDLDDRVAREARAAEPLGKTLALAETRAPELELEPLSPAAPKKPAVGELELELPPPAVAAPPPAPVSPPVQPVLRAPSVQPVPRRAPVEPAPSPPAAEEAPAKPVVPEIAARPAIAPATPAARFAEAHQSFAPQSFLELLDAALALEG